jgi:Leucine-rich repeat (LRR) protein
VPPPEVIEAGCEKTIEYLYRFLVGKRTRALNLSDMGLRSVPREVFELPGLTSLAMCSNKLERIPEDLRLLTQLKELLLDDNRI